ncbi:hybrid sensor histidine kinase/response regulator [Roseofilum casamattae]|uniref:histidine kinase n=1 Tax=Roseofilum casamattae BLCC-M143 TaxID=3022442 RepID=A0ABT7BWZ2_9CYAN|nr:hybrid sensor histidine kinase/response regulator [Roseofilum casamattae]MDJ1182976.1 hybrid sensor histidine kinase/response regulator [Roseofilum casamattae BLCC-M143]
MNVDRTLLGQIVVVDDTPANLHLLSNLLKNVGYDVRPFPRATMAWQGINYSPPDLILLDIQMPEMDGYELCKKLKSHTPTEEIPVIFISSLNETFDKLKAFQNGGVDYITKPFQAEEVLMRVATHLELYQIKQRLQTINNRQAEQLTEQNAQLVDLNQSLERVNQELHQNYEELKQTQLQLVQTEKMATLGNLVAGVAHEMNNPVGFMSNNLNTADEYVRDLLDIIALYQEKYPNPDAELTDKLEECDIDFICEDFPNLIDSMNLGCDRIRNVSKSLRTFSRSDTDRKSMFDLHEGLDSTLLILKYRLKANEKRPAIKIVKNYSQLPEVKCYAGQINQVFMNILANGIDALDESNKGKTFAQIQTSPNCLTITTEFNAETKHVTIRIADNGIGIPGDLKTKIFEQGFTTKGVGKGTGLGMAIAYEIVTEKHGGTLTFYSQPSEGTEFTLTLPLS